MEEEEINFAFWAVAFVLGLGYCAMRVLFLANLASTGAYVTNVTEIEARVKGGASTSYEYKYTFEVEGERFSGSGNRDELTAGGVTVYYDSEDPADNYLEKPGLLWPGVVTAILGLLSVPPGLIVWRRRKERRQLIDAILDPGESDDDA